MCSQSCTDLTTIVPRDARILEAKKTTAKRVCMRVWVGERERGRERKGCSVIFVSVLTL